MGNDFEVLGEIRDVETIADNLSIREKDRLKAHSVDGAGVSLKEWRWFASPMIWFVMPNYIGTKRMASAAVK